MVRKIQEFVQTFYHYIFIYNLVYVYMPKIAVFNYKQLRTLIVH